MSFGSARMPSAKSPAVVIFPVVTETGAASAEQRDELVDTRLLTGSDAVEDGADGPTGARRRRDEWRINQVPTIACLFKAGDR